MHKIFIFSILASIISTNAWAQNIDTLWRARGLEAQSNLTQLKKKNLSKIELCKQRLEFGFSLIVDPKGPALIDRIDGKNKYISAQLFIRNEENKSISIRFSYLENTLVPAMVIPSTLEGLSTSGWTITLLPSEPGGSFGVQDNSCVYYFRPTDYLHPLVKSL